MAARKDYSLQGIATDVQFGKSGGRFVWNTDRFESTSNGVTLAQLRVPTTPINDNDATSKIYVDSKIQGLDTKDSVRAATDVAGILATDFDNGKTIDGIVLATGDRILIKNQANPIENGIYVVPAAGVPVRSVDANAAGELSGGTFAFVEEGTINGDTGWVISTNGSITPGVDPNNWVKFSSAGVVTAGTGLTKAGAVFNLNIGATTITVDGADDVIVNSSAVVGQTLLSAGVAGTEAAWGALDLTNANATAGPLLQSRGGLGSDVSGFAANSLYVVGVGQTTAALSIGVNGNVLRTVAGTPTWGQIDLSDNTNTVTGVLDETNGGTGINAYVRGDVIVATAANTLGAVAIGAVNQVLTSDGTDAAWANPTPASGSVVTLVAPVVFGGGVTQLIGTVPAGGRVIKITFNVTTVWDAVTAIEIGDAGNTARLMIAAENDPAGIALYSTDIENVYAGATVVNATLTVGGATTGAASVIVQYIQP